MLESRVADAELFGSLARCEKRGGTHCVLIAPCPQLYTQLFNSGLRPSDCSHERSAPDACDCNHSTVLGTDDTLPGDFLPGPCGALFSARAAFRRSLGRDHRTACITAIKNSHWRTCDSTGLGLLLSGRERSFAASWPFSLRARPSAADIGTPDMQKIAGAIKEGARAVLEAAVQDRDGPSGPAASHIRLCAAGTRGRRRSQPGTAGSVDGAVSSA